MFKAGNVIMTIKDRCRLTNITLVVIGDYTLKYKHNKMKYIVHIYIYQLNQYNLKAISIGTIAHIVKMRAIRLDGGNLWDYAAVKDCPDAKCNLTDFYTEIRTLKPKIITSTGVRNTETQ